MPAELLSNRPPPLVTPGLVPGAYVFLIEEKFVDGRDKPGHDDGEMHASE